MIRNILWDVDGTLFDTHPAITYAINRSLNQMGLAVPMNEIDGLVRRSIDDCITVLSRRFKLEPDMFRLRFDESYLSIPAANQPPFTGVHSVCSLFQERGGSNILVTHHNVESTQQLLDTHNFGHLFLGIFDVEQGYPLKPDPALLKVVMECLHLERSETLIVGSRDIDVQAGHTVGIRTCLFGDAPLSEPADLQIFHYNELLKWLEKQI